MSDAFAKRAHTDPPRVILRGQACKCSFLSSISDTRALCFGLCDFFVVEPVCHHQEEIRLAVASRSPVDEGGAARGILGALGLIDKFCCLEIHRGSKAVHFQVGSLFAYVCTRETGKGSFYRVFACDLSMYRRCACAGCLEGIVRRQPCLQTC